MYMCANVLRSANVYLVYWYPVCGLMALYLRLLSTSQIAECQLGAGHRCLCPSTERERLYCGQSNLCPQYKQGPSLGSKKEWQGSM